MLGNPSWYGNPCYDTVFVVQDEDQAGMEGMLITQVSFVNEDSDDGETVPCALTSWFLPDSNEHEHDTGM